MGVKFNIGLSKYQTLVFDCDGVVLNSNKIKTEAFYEAAKHYGHDSAQALVDYHVRNGGISRYAKFEYFFREILKQEVDLRVMNEVLLHFALAVKEGLMISEVADGLDQLKENTKSTKWLIVSGGDQAELQEIFAKKKLAQYFNGGIFGSPDTKVDILKRELDNKNITKPGLFIGDSKYDYQASSEVGLDFVFISQWTEVKEWQKYIQQEKLNMCVSLNKLIGQR